MKHKLTEEQKLKFKEVFDKMKQKQEQMIEEYKKDNTKPLPHHLKKRLEREERKHK